MVSEWQKHNRRTAISLPPAERLQTAHHAGERETFHVRRFLNNRYSCARITHEGKAGHYAQAGHQIRSAAEHQNAEGRRRIGNGTEASLQDVGQALEGR